jgi:hypothetical protein
MMCGCHKNSGNRKEEKKNPTAKNSLYMAKDETIPNLKAAGGFIPHRA